MKLSSLLSQTLSDAWCIHLDGAMNYLPYALKYLKEGDFEISVLEQQSIKEAHSICFINANGSISAEDANQNEEYIAVVPIKGALTRMDIVGKPGYESLAKTIKQLDSNPQVTGILLYVSSPGGQARGIEYLVDAIKGTEKEIFTFSNDLIASAAYWISSATDKIIVDGRSSLVGSIGTMLGTSDMKGILEKLGAKFADATATASIDKNAAIKALMDGDAKPVQDQLLNPLNDLFLTDVKNNRDGRLNLTKENALTGKVYLRDTALEIGLIDHSGDMNFALSLFKKSPKTATNTPNTHMKIEMSKFPAFMALLGFESAESTADGVHLQASHLTLLENELTKGAEAKEQVGTLTAEKETLTQSLSDKEAKVTSLEGEVTSLKAAHVPAPGQAPNATDADHGEETASEFYSEADAELQELTGKNQ
jgi:ClpP class serine protease